jgi:hypothetical protein
MTKKSIKLLIAVLAMILTVSVFATGFVGALSQDEAMSTTQFAEFGDDSGASTSLQKIIGAGITIVQVVGSGVAIIMLVVLAIKYISAAPGDKAEIKKHAVVYVIGAIVLFAASGILGIVKNFAGNINEEGEGGAAE